jgi:hypothetical protein
MGNNMGNMGNILEYSRGVKLPENINDPDYRSMVIKSWTENNILEFVYNKLQYETHTTLRPDILEKAGESIKIYFDKINDLKIIDIFSGNLCASVLIHKFLEEKVTRWICTDAVNYKFIPEPTCKIKYEQLNVVDAVAKHGVESNILLMISPPPTNNNRSDLGCGDYYACFDYINQSLKNEQIKFITKYIIFIGELGASDGTEGIYDYLMNHKNLNLVCRELLSKENDMFGGSLEKELFIFKIVK